MDTNFDNNNAHVKASFDIYNIASTNADASEIDTSNTENAKGTGVSHVNGIKDVDSIGGADNNIDGKNAYINTAFSTYNISNTNADITACNTSNIKDISSTCASNTSGIRDVDSIGDANNNIDGKNTYIQACFGISNIANAGADNTSNTNKKISNNTNNKSADWLGRIYRIDKVRLSRANNIGLNQINKDKINESNKNTPSQANKSEVSGANKGKIGRANNNGVDRTNFESSKKVGVRAVTNINNCSNCGKVNNPYTSFASLAFASLAIANYINDFNLAVFDKISSSAATPTFDRFVAIFAAFANTTLIRKTNICEFNLFLFTNHQ